MPISEPFVGTWDVYAGPTHSELVLKPDGSYSHAFWGGAQGHWGTWTVENMAGTTVLAMQLQGAQPTVMNGPYGPQPIEWPATEQWAVASVQPNQVNLFGALMVRRCTQFSAVPSGPPPVAAGGFPEPQGKPAVANPAPQSPRGVAQPQSGMDLSVLGSYLHPAMPGPVPAVHSPQILNQWQNLQFNAMQTAGSSLFTAPQPPAFSAPVSPAFTQQMLSEDNNTAANIFKQQHAANLDWFNARAEAILNEENARHTIAQKYINYAGR